MQDTKPSPLHAYLAGLGTDDSSRTLDDALAFSDDALEYVHDYIQWLFPLPTRSMAQPGAPILTPQDIAQIRTDERALANLQRASQRMREFYERTDGWLTFNDHNHLRITRILRSLKLLVGPEVANDFYAFIAKRHENANAPVNPRNVRYWTEALAE
ncbi:opioid growth factor receptor-related protein [Microvirga flavescens]|uniref:opioid growth factor receptor-related protein n=1 Tax=Microvirga flavescens TaxID=2249811 RepID=UPI000DD77681|nr:opioid growth factor receptor-related protein [Microvirga flavescens]